MPGRSRPHKRASPAELPNALASDDVLRQFATKLPAAVGQLIYSEAHAPRLIAVSPTRLPALLRSPSHSLALGAGEADKMTPARLKAARHLMNFDDARQDLVFNRVLEPDAVTIAVGLAALQDSVRFPNQMQHILDLTSGRAGVSLRIIPAELEVYSAFTLFPNRSSTTTPAVFIEEDDALRQVTHSDVLARYAEIEEEVLLYAYPHDRSLQYVEYLADRQALGH